MGFSMKKGYLVQAWLVLVLACVFGVALAYVSNFTAPRIEKNIKSLIATKLAEMFGEGTETANPIIIQAVIEGRSKKVPCYPAIRNGKRIGWGILAEGKGYDTLTLLIGVDEQVKVLKGYRVIKSLETPGIGSKITKPFFYKQFEGQDATKPLIPVPPGKKCAPQEINTISGATISSKGVTTTINENLAAVRDKLLEAISKEGK